MKVLGALFKIPLQGIIGAYGMGLFHTAYHYLGPVFTLATAGFPVAVSRLVSEQAALGRWEQVRRARRQPCPCSWPWGQGAWGCWGWRHPGTAGRSWGTPWRGPLWLPWPRRCSWGTVGGGVPGLLGGACGTWPPPPCPRFWRRWCGWERAFWGPGRPWPGAGGSGHPGARCWAATPARRASPWRWRRWERPVPWPGSPRGAGPRPCICGRSPGGGTACPWARGGTPLPGRWGGSSCPFCCRWGRGLWRGTRRGCWRPPCSPGGWPRPGRPRPRPFSPCAGEACPRRPCPSPRRCPPFSTAAAPWP